MITPIGEHIHAVRIRIIINFNGFLVAPDRTVKPLVPNSIVSSTLLLTILSWLMESCSMEDVIVRLRQRTVPSGYAIHSWIPGVFFLQLKTFIPVCNNYVAHMHAGKEEATVDKLRSILAQLEFTAIVRDYAKKGISFDTQLHVPEVHEVTGDTILQREDEGHLFKVLYL